MFENLSDFYRVWVVGPQRSGTRIATKMIARDTGHEMLDEVQFYIDSLSHLWSQVMIKKTDRDLVIHGPAITPFVHHFATKADIVIMMVRSLEDIHASEERIGWAYDTVERYKMALPPKPGDHGARFSAEGKYGMWDSWMKKTLRNMSISTMELSYDSLAEHPLWKPKGKRERFKWNQTR